MNEYEITYLSSPQLSEEARTALDAAVDAMLDTLQGAINHSEPTARRRLMYPIKKQVIGFARTLNIAVDPARIEEVRAMLSKHNDVLRATIIKTPRREEVTTAIFDEIDKPTARIPESKPVEKVSTKKVTMEEVEEKIEEALDEEVK